MSDQASSPPPDPFEDLCQTLWAVKVLAETGQGFAELRDTDGIFYALKRCDETLQRAVSIYNEAREAAHARAD